MRNVSWKSHLPTEGLLGVLARVIFGPLEWAATSPLAVIVVPAWVAFLLLVATLSFRAYRRTGLRSSRSWALFFAFAGINQALGFVCLRLSDGMLASGILPWTLAVLASAAGITAFVYLGLVAFGHRDERAG